MDYDEKFDSWGLGVTLYNLITGKMPFAAENSKNRKKVDYFKKYKKAKFGEKAWK